MNQDRQRPNAVKMFLISQLGGALKLGMHQGLLEYNAQITEAEGQIGAMTEQKIVGWLRRATDGLVGYSEQTARRINAANQEEFIARENRAKSPLGQVSHQVVTQAGVGVASMFGNEVLKAVESLTSPGGFGQDTEAPIRERRAERRRVNREARAAKLAARRQPVVQTQTEPGTDVVSAADIAQYKAFMTGLAAGAAMAGGAGGVAQNGPETGIGSQSGVVGGQPGSAGVVIDVEVPDNAPGVDVNKMKQGRSKGGGLFGGVTNIFRRGGGS